MEDDPNIYERGTKPQEMEVLDTLVNCAGSSRRGRCNSFSQASSNTFATQHSRSFMNNMNNNMQGMLMPLMLILQQGQDRAEEQEMLRREHEEERQLQEVQMRTEDQ
ncbi:hypothetical protein O181_102675 [Austropuccinia psidii MF-1]|uniref:Uncharacterized protein n=1 Tax=Austropuccinia psidii MF-1 TaxID=1389203 RepID=A0A9Q3JK09_9BASI|nr:hypothetical protein [Austropuccinia psidii MF-1]